MKPVSGKQFSAIADITPGSGVAPPPTPSDVGRRADTGNHVIRKIVAGAGAASGATATVIAIDNAFSPVNLSINAKQQITLTLENKGDALHNRHVLNLTGSDGKQITTQLIAGGNSDTISFTAAKSGTFDIICDVHPADMRGKLTVR